jgi:hypothetical protein
MNSSSNSVESDLTELSWLTTNNIQMFSSAAAYHQQQTRTKSTLIDKSKFIQNVNKDDDDNKSVGKKRPRKINDQNETEMNRFKKIKIDKLCLSNDFDSSYSSSNSSNSSSNSDISINTMNDKKRISSPATPLLSPSEMTAHNLDLSSFQSLSSPSFSPSPTPSQSSLSSLSLSQASLSSSSSSLMNQLEMNNDDFSFKNNCGFTKPPLTLTCLIFMALEESDSKCLPVREIYEWIEENFPFYQNVSNGGWKSSIRHNLSFSRCFVKMNRNEYVLLRHGQSGDFLKCEIGEIIKSQQEKHLRKQQQYLQNGRKRRAPNSTGTCWKVNPDYRSTLVQNLKKSSFWFHNRRHYSKLNRLLIDDDDYTTQIQPMSTKSIMKRDTNVEQVINMNKKNHKKGIPISTQQQQQGNRKSKINHCCNVQVNRSLINSKLNELNESYINNNRLQHVTYSPVSQSQLDSSSSSSVLSSSFGSFTTTSSSSSSASASSLSPPSLRDSNYFQNMAIPIFNDKITKKQSTKQLIHDNDNKIKMKIKVEEEEEVSNSPLEIEVASFLVGMKWIASKNRMNL